MTQLDLFQPVSLSSYNRQEHLMSTTKPVQQLAITAKTIEQAIKLLKATGCQYKIIDVAGNEYGDLKVVAEKGTKKRKSTHAYGSVTNHFKPYLKDLDVGDVAVVPIDKFEHASLLSCVAAWCVTNWGKGNARTCRSGDTIQVLRCG
jgi:hypothetical protein